MVQTTLHLLIQNFTHVLLDNTLTELCNVQGVHVLFHLPSFNTLQTTEPNSQGYDTLFSANKFSSPLI